MLTTDTVFEEFKTHVGDSVIEKVEFIRLFNKLLSELKLTKPAEQVSKLYYCVDWKNYALPTGFRNPISLRNENQLFMQYVSPYIFALRTISEMYTEQSDAGIRFMQVVHKGTNSQKALVSECDDLTADGTWSISGGSDLAIQENEKKSGGGSLQFSVNGLQTIVTFIRTNVIDVSGFTEHLRQRLYMKFSTVPSSVVLRVGNDASNYFEHTLTTQVTGQAFTTDGFNELEFSRQSSTETGTVDLTNMDWFQFELNFSVATVDTGFLIDKVELIKPEPLDFEWYTSYVALNSASELIEKITEDIDTTDNPLVLNYPDYLNTILDGLGYLFFKNRGDAEAKGIYRADYLSKKVDNIVISGVSFLANEYPDRSAKYRREKRLPELYSQFGNYANRK